MGLDAYGPSRFLQQMGMIENKPQAQGVGLNKSFVESEEAYLPPWIKELSNHLNSQRD